MATPLFNEAERAFNEKYPNGREEEIIKGIEIAKEKKVNSIFA
ncbi:MAG: hypothetical protein ACETWM_22290 [Candidatus Lokiarchaeia archaeon]